MRNWSIWDWIAYGCLAIAAFGAAIGAASKEVAPSMLDRLPEAFQSSLWTYFPVFLVILGTAILVVKELLHVRAPAASSPNPEPSVSQKPPSYIREANVY